MENKVNIIKMSKKSLEDAIASGKVAVGNSIEEFLGTKRAQLAQDEHDARHNEEDQPE